MNEKEMTVKLEKKVKSCGECGKRLLRLAYDPENGCAIGSCMGRSKSGGIVTVCVFRCFEDGEVLRLPIIWKKESARLFCKFLNQSIIGEVIHEAFDECAEELLDAYPELEKLRLPGESLKAVALRLGKTAF